MTITNYYHEWDNAYKSLIENLSDIPKVNGDKQISNSQ